MAEFPALTLWTDAYLSDTRRLTTLQHGAYLLLLIEAWRRPNCDLPDDDHLLAHMVGLPDEEWMTIQPVVMAFWKHDRRRKVFVQKRLLLERDRARTRSRAQADKAAKRWDKTKNSDAAALPEKSRGNASTATATATAIKEKNEEPNGSFVPAAAAVGDDDGIFASLDFGEEPQPEPEKPLTPSEIMESWNRLASELSLPKVEVLSVDRQKNIRARLTSYPELRYWQQAFNTIRQSAFLRGENKSGWKADFDFLIQAKSFNRLVEGSYSNGA